jgi:hypothetical protein
MSQQIQAVGMVWFKRENFERLMSMFEDRHKLHRTFDEWLRDSEIGRKVQEAKGVRVVCVDIDPDAFGAWCVGRGLRVNAQSRMDYANLIAYKVLTGAEPPDGVQ